LIKIGCAAYSYRQHLQSGAMSLDDFVEKCYEMGLDGVELTGYYFPTREKSYLRRLRRLALSMGLCISGAAAGSNFCRPEEAARRKEVETVGEWVEVARELGAPCLRVFAGAAPEGCGMEQATAWVVEALKECAEIGREAGVVIALENHGGVTARAESVVRMVGEAGSEWLGVNLDLGNYHANIYEEIAQTIPYAVHVHAKVSETGVGRPLDYERIKGMLQERGYNGFLSIEYEEDEEPCVGVPRFAEHLLRVFSWKT